MNQTKNILKVVQVLWVDDERFITERTGFNSLYYLLKLKSFYLALG